MGIGRIAGLHRLRVGPPFRHFSSVNFGPSLPPRPGAAFFVSGIMTALLSVKVAWMEYRGKQLQRRRAAPSLADSMGAVSLPFPIGLGFPHSKPSGESDGKHRPQDTPTADHCVTIFVAILKLSQRTWLVTFAQVPDRDRIHVISFEGGDHAWDCWH